jgi:phospholipid/cholesterol/gamma-HCH transport system substrate-binding protein
VDTIVFLVSQDRLMEPQTRYTVIGAAVLALALAAALALVWLSDTGRAADFRFYTIYFERQSLEGLQIGGDVNMRGVKVGRVESYTISRDNINRVRVVVRVDRETPVSENTLAVVSRNLLTGIARINLETPGTPGPELVMIPRGERHPVIPEGTSNIDQIAGAANRLAVSADAALTNLNELLSPENIDSVNQTLAAVRDLASGLNQRLDAFDRTARSIEQAATGFQKSSDAIAGSVGEITEHIGPLARDAGAAMREAQGSLQALTEVAQALERDLRQAVTRLERDTSGFARRADAAVDAGLHELRATTEELRASVDIITRTMDRLQDPKALLLGPSERQMGPGERGR